VKSPKSKKRTPVRWRRRHRTVLFAAEVLLHFFAVERNVQTLSFLFFGNA